MSASISLDTIWIIMLTSTRSYSHRDLNFIYNDTWIYFFSSGIWVSIYLWAPILSRNYKFCCKCECELWLIQFGFSFEILPAIIGEGSQHVSLTFVLTKLRTAMRVWRPDFAEVVDVKAASTNVYLEGLAKGFNLMCSSMLSGEIGLEGSCQNDALKIKEWMWLD